MWREPGRRVVGRCRIGWNASYDVVAAKPMSGMRY